MKLNGAQILCESLVKEGVEVIFGFPGGALLPFYDALPNYPQLRHILVRHEQGAAHAADSYARVSGKVGVCLATSGPGATNLVTGIANAYLDSAPMVAITGQVSRPFIGKDAFQEIDITGITLPITELRELAEKAQIPVVNTLLGLGCFPRSHLLSLGMLGMHGLAHVNLALDAADLVIAIGMRFDDRATSKVSTFAPHARVIHIDIDPAEIGKNVKVDVPIVGDVKNVLRALNKVVDSKNHVEWVSRIQEWEREHPSTVIRDTDSLLPQYIVRQISEITKGDAIIVTGVGQHQMWSAQYFQYNKPNTLVSAGGLGPMGFELPAAMGAKVGSPNDTVWCIAGDGGFQMTIQELGTIVQENLAVKIAILNNGFLGMVRQWQELFYERRYIATPLSGPDFVKVAEAYGIAAMRVTDKLMVTSAIEKAMAYEGPFLIDFQVEPEENVYPMVPPGASLCDIVECPREEVRVK